MIPANVYVQFGQGCPHRVLQMQRTLQMRESEIVQLDHMRQGDDDESPHGVRAQETLSSCLPHVVEVLALDSTECNYQMLWFTKQCSHSGTSHPSACSCAPAATRIPQTTHPVCE